MTSALHILLSTALARVVAFTPGNPPSPLALAVQRSLDAAIASNAPTFSLPANAVLQFNAANFNVTNAGAMAIDGGNATLLFEPGSGVSVTNCTGTRLSNFLIDYSPLPYVFGTLTAVAPSSITVSLDPTSLTFENLTAWYAPHDTYPPPTLFRGGKLLRPVCTWGQPAPASPLGGGVYAVRCSGADAAVGDVLVAATRVGITLSLTGCARVAVHGVRILSAGYMAVTEFQGDGGNSFEGVTVAAPSPARPLGSNADGFHSSGAKVGPRLSRVTIKGLLDDYFNVHTTAQLFIGPSWGSFLVGDYQLFAGGAANYGTQTTMDRVAAGETLSFFPLNTFSYPPLATATVTSIARVDGADALLADAYAAASRRANATPCSACRAGLNKFATAQLWNVSFSAPLLGVPPLSFTTADAISAGGAVVEGCTFSDSVSNLGRFKSSGGVIAGTTWARTGSQNLEIEPLQNWLEGPFGIHNVTIRDCVFHGTAASPVHTFGAVDVREVNSTYDPTKSDTAPFDLFLPPLANTAALGGDLSPPFAVPTPAACASACASAPACLSFNVGPAPPPAGPCGIREECWEGNASSCPSTLRLACPGGAAFTGVAFASYGLPQVTAPPCGFVAAPACDAPGVAAIVAAACVGRSECAIDVTLAALGGVDPCVGHVKFLAVALKGACGTPPPLPHGDLQCTLSGASRLYELSPAPNTSYFQRLLPRNDSRVALAVPYALDVPARGVALRGDGLLAGGFASNVAYLTSPAQGSVDDLLFPYRARFNTSSRPPGQIWGWDGFVPGSVASALLMGAGGALRWTEHGALRALLTDLLDGIAACQEGDGFAVGYPRGDTNADMGGNNQLPSYVNSWFTHGLLEAAFADGRALGIARGMNSWWNNCTYLPQLFPMDGGEDHAGPIPHGFDPASGTQSSAPFAHGHLLYWMNQAGIGHSRMAMSEAGTQADVDFLRGWFQEDWWLAALAARNKSAIWARKWYPDNYEVCVLEAYLDLYSLTGNATYLAAVLGGFAMFRDPVQGWLFPGGSFAINENYLYPPGAFPLEFDGRWGVDTRPTGEFCPSAFWIKLSQRLHRLFPAEEAYVGEIERSLINVGLAGQAGARGVRYFARLHGTKDPPTVKGTCCEGQSARIFGAAPEFVFSVAPNGALVSVDLLEPATLVHVVGGVGVNISVSTDWPYDSRVDVLVAPAAPLPAGALDLALRLPLWAQPEGGVVQLLLNGAPLGGAGGAPGTYAEVKGLAWAAAVANVSYVLPMGFSAVNYTGVTQKPPFRRAAYTFGPFLLAVEGPWDAALDCVVLNVSGGGALSPERWLLPPPGTRAGALPPLGSAFSVAGSPAARVRPYFEVDDGERFTAFPIVVAVGAAAQRAQLRHTPRFSWDTVPLFFHSTNTSGLWSAEALARMASFPLITFDKGQGRGNASDGRPGEARALDAARQVRAALGARATLLFYQNSFIDWQEFSAHQALVRDPTLRAKNATGADALFQGPHGSHFNAWLFNSALPAARNLVTDACLSLVDADGGATYDGCFLDRAGGCGGKGDSCGFGDEAVMTPPQLAAFDAGHAAQLRNLTAALAARGKLALWNNNPGSPSALMIENFGANETCVLALREAAAAGLVVEAHAGDPASGSDAHCTNTTNALSAFLVGAGERAYFACSNYQWDSDPAWPAAPDPWLDPRPEYGRPLGPPLGDATRDAAGLWSRNFSKGTRVWFDAATGSGRIEWGDGAVEQGVGATEAGPAACSWLGKR